MLNRIAPLLGLVALASAAQAQITFDSNIGPQQNYQNGALVANYAPTTATNSAVLLAVAVDAVPTWSATYGGTPMTLLANDQRTAIFSYVPVNTTAQDIVLNTGAAASTTGRLVYGTISGIQTTPLTVDAEAGATFSSSTLSLDAALSVSTGDYVLSALNANSLVAGSVSSVSAGQSVLDSFLGTTAGGYAGVITGGTITGSFYTPTASFGTITNNSSANFGSAVAFTAIPEPSALTLFLGSMIALGVLRRRRLI